MATPSVELKVDISGIPHSFLYIVNPDGSKSAYGFAPAQSGQLIGDGKIQDDIEHELESIV
jgi:hypothetical protein